MSDLHSQLRDYVESTIERVDVEDVVAAVSAEQTTDPRPTFRRRPVWVAAGAGLLVALLIGVPLVLVRGGNSTTVDQSATTEVATISTVVPTTQPVPETTAPPETVAPLPGVPLADAVPGFTDAIVMITTEGFTRVLRWDPLEATPDVLITAGGSPVGLDASLGWFAMEFSNDDLNNDLVIYQVPAAASGPAPRTVVASDVESAIWHDTDAGQLTYLACPEPASGTATLFTLDITDPAAEPIRIRAFDQGCQGDPIVDGWQVGDLLLDMWHDDATVVRVFNGDTFESVLIGADGAEVPGNTDAAMVPEGPNGERLDTAEIIARGEAIWEASWSPDGTHLALLISTLYPDGSFERILRVVDAATGATLVETPELDVNAIPGSPVWSSDSRFVVYHSWQQPTDLMEGLDDETGTASLNFYDTATNTITMVPLHGFVDEIRIP